MCPESVAIEPGDPFIPGVTVVVMAYNEVATLQEVVAEIGSALDSIGPSAGEILIVDDGSTDGTGEIADRLSRGSESIRAVHHLGNLGLGEVYRSGLVGAGREFVTFFPADGQFPASIIPRFFELAQQQDLVLGFVSERDGWLGRTLSWLQRALYRVLVGRLPKFQGVLMLRRSVLRAVHVMPSGRAATLVYEMILKVMRAGYRVTSVATECRPRRSGHSKVNNWQTIRSNLTATLSLRKRMAGCPQPERRTGESPT
jgi:dolichol-phosphate mannosyltransferase